MRDGLMAVFRYGAGAAAGVPPLWDRAGGLCRGAKSPARDPPWSRARGPGKRRGGRHAGRAWARRSTTSILAPWRAGGRNPRPPLLAGRPCSTATNSPVGLTQLRLRTSTVLVAALGLNYERRRNPAAALAAAESRADAGPVSRRC